MQGRLTRLDYGEHIDRLQAETLTEGTEPAEAVAGLLLDILKGRKSKSRYLVTRVAKVGTLLKRLLGSRFDAVALRSQPVREQNSSS